MTQVRQYSTFKKEFFSEGQSEKMSEFYREYGLAGTEVFMDDVRSRDKTLFCNSVEKENLIKKLNKPGVKRLHCSYWAYPTSFLTKNNFTELVEKFETVEAIIEYYGDLTGSHIFDRWVQEYELACAIDAQAYTFHLIDYASIDGKWEFTLSRKEIHQAMIFLIQQFINLLKDKNLLTESSPQIELENAGWGLEYGIQTAEDFSHLFKQLYDPFKKVKIAWDINHLLHAIGFDEKLKSARFFLPENEITEDMKTLEKKYGNQPDVFAQKWLENNILHPEMVQYIGCLQLSDCSLKNIEYFRNGKLTGKYYNKLSSLKTSEQQENYGVDIVLSEYDSHIVLGTGILVPSKIKTMILQIMRLNPDIVILHELKNSVNQMEDLKKQIELLDLNWSGCD